MIEKYDPYANAIAERVNGALKQEFLLEEYRCDMSVPKKIVDESIYIYNNRRPHTPCYMLTSEQMHKQTELIKQNYGEKTKSASGLQPTC